MPAPRSKRPPGPSAPTCIIRAAGLGPCSGCGEPSCTLMAPRSSAGRPSASRSQLPRPDPPGTASQLPGPNPPGTPAVEPWGRHQASRPPLLVARQAPRGQADGIGGRAVCGFRGEEPDTKREKELGRVEHGQPPPVPGRPVGVCRRHIPHHRPPPSVKARGQVRSPAPRRCRHGLHPVAARATHAWGAGPRTCRLHWCRSDCEAENGETPRTVQAFVPRRPRLDGPAGASWALVRQTVEPGVTRWGRWGPLRMHRAGPGVERAR